jgi:uncharacterized protein involved in exopolysaccharide biosynthesis
LTDNFLKPVILSLSKDQFSLGKKRKPMKSLSVVLVLIPGLLLAGCGANTAPKMYSATAEIHIEPLISVMMSLPEASAQIATHLQFMQSSDILTPIVQELKLDQIWAKRFQSNHDALSAQEALDHLSKVLKIEAVPGKNIVMVTACSEIPQEAADIANALVDHYKAYLDKEEAVRNKRGEDSLRDAITQQQQAVDNAKAAIEKLRLNLGYIGPTLPNEHKDPLIPFRDAQRDLIQQQSLFDALNNRLKEVIHDIPLQESRVRIISRAVAPPE